MSDQHNRFENLQSDEERSVEESLMGSDTADFLESEDEAKVRVPGAEGDEDILAKDDQGVTLHICAQSKFSVNAANFKIAIISGQALQNGNS